ncbi:MAG TPA: hypothetical protein VMP01_01620 [Pirellulaceae bacterium]|nr:hypothetical protein [Pirellulaceae bacterium]
MSRTITCLALGLALGLVSIAHGQFSFGIGVGSGYGRGGGFYGPGYYGRGFYGPGFYGPGFYGPGYGSGIGIRVGNRGYYDDYYYGGRGYYYARPQVNRYYILPNNNVAATPRVLPDNKITPTKLTLQEGDILIKSPPDAPGDVGYGINDKWVYTIEPGQKQKLEAGRQWTIEFNRGIDGAQAARYTLDAGIYEFHFSDDAGWELQRVSDSVLSAATESLPAADDAVPPGKPAGVKDGADDVGLPAEAPSEE